MENSHQYRKKICRLCLMKCDKYEVLQRSLLNYMDVLLLNINLRLSEEPAICKTCAEIVKKCFYFKRMCLDTYKYIVSFINDKKIDLKNVYLSKKEYVTGAPKDCNICAFCMALVKSCFAISLDNEEDNMLQKMFEKCFPELDFSIVKDPIICAPCHEQLKKYFGFVRNCLFMEEEIGKYYETRHNKNSKTLIDLTDVLQFTLRNKVTCGEDVTTIDENKVEKYRIHTEHFYEVGEYENEGITEVEDQKLNNLSQFPLQNTSLDIIDKDGSKIELQGKSCDGTENIVVKHEIKHDLETFIKIERYKYDDTLVSTRIMSEEVGVNQIDQNFDDGQVVQKNENYVGVEDQKYLFNDEIEIKTDPHDFSSFQMDSSTLLTSNDFLKNRKYSELDHHLLDPLEATMYQCESCPYQTKRKRNLKSHTLVHIDPSKITMYQCEFCSYQTKRKHKLKSHLLVHKDTSKVIMYQCESCPFQTKRKCNLKTHSLHHEDPSKVTMYRCEFCPYETKHKDLLKSHLLIHKDTSEVRMYQCETCLFQTKYKRNLKSHSLVHKDPSKVSMYQCGSCTYQTKYKIILKRHLLEHMDPSKVTMYLCEFCSYQTKHKDLLKSHLLVHKDTSEVLMYQCESCSFQTKRKYCLKTHSLVHKDPSKVTMHRCELCPYQTKYKHELKNHLLVHKDISEVIMFQCESCPFQTKRKDSLKRHSLIHKDPSKVTMYQCELCPYQTKHKPRLKSHLLVHMDTSEVIMYQCESCSFQTKRKGNLTRHSVLHRDPSKVNVPL